MVAPNLSVVVHGHFYQPPRENPWTGTIEAQPSAAPYHDWNERIEAECYRTVVAARVPGAEGRIASIENLLYRISFNFGPTLLDWLETHSPDTYGAILEADRISRKRTGGHGNALAQPYHHTILPLASRREKVTEVRWGIADFRRRFGRNPEGMWLPEAAVDGETLDVLAQEGIAFTIVAPHQLEELPSGGWPGRLSTPRGRSIVLFPYDGPLSHGVAFGSLLEDAEAWAGAILKTGREEGEESPPGEGEAPDGKPPSRRPKQKVPLPANRLVSIATDGETYGHHHRFGEMALASVLESLSGTEGVRVENYSSFLSRTRALEEVVLKEPSSWSCTHGVERWRSDCGCRMDPSLDTQQAWRAPLREAMDWLSARLHDLYGTEGGALMDDPWGERDRLGELAEDDGEGVAELIRQGASRSLTPAEEKRAAELLEMERNSLRLFTSCGWFFDDLAGIEPVQVLRYAARALDLAGPRGEEMESGFLAILEKAVSNEDPPRNGRTVFLEEAKPSSLIGTRGVSPEIKEELQPGPATELISLVEGLDPECSDEELLSDVERIRELADLHSSRDLPIPFHAQTLYFRLLQKARPDKVRLLDTLREPLGFVPPR
jgi:hypothetical protein